MSIKEWRLLSCS